MEYCNEVWFIYTREAAIIFIISIYSLNVQNHLRFTDEEIGHCGAK